MTKKNRTINIPGDSEQDLSILCNNNNKRRSFYRELERLKEQVKELEVEKADLEEKTKELRGKLADVSILSPFFQSALWEWVRSVAHLPIDT